MTVRAARRSAKPSESREHVAIQPPPETQLPAIQQNGEAIGGSALSHLHCRFGWNSAAASGLAREFCADPRFAEGRPDLRASVAKSPSISCAVHGSRIGRDPIIAVHDMQALIKGGTSGFHGFRLSLGLLRTPEQALMGLQAFARFLVEHRHSSDLEADIRTRLRREGFAGAIEIAMHHEAREIGE